VVHVAHPAGGGATAYCSDGSHPSSKVAPLKESPRHLSMYDRRREVDAHQHLLRDTSPVISRRKDPNYTLWTSAADRAGGVVAG